MPTDPSTPPTPPTTYSQDLPAPAVAPEGVPLVIAFILGSAAVTAIARWSVGHWASHSAGQLAASIVGFLTGVLTLWCVWFFRDPARRIPISRAGDVGVPLLISPADGVVCFVGPALPPEELNLPDADRRALTRVSVFMNVFNVHVNRAPIAGVVEKIAYRPGKFFNASLDKASEHNERSSILLRLADGRPLVCTQIAGLIARRIVCRVREGAHLATGQRFGIIRFGSRVDVYLPRGVEPMVKVGDKSVAGETVFAILTPNQVAESKPSMPIPQTATC